MKHRRAYSINVRLQMELSSEDPGFVNRIMYYPHIEIGPHITYQGERNRPSRDTELILSHEIENLEDRIAVVRNVEFSRPGREFAGVNVFGLTRADEETGVTSFEVRPSLTTADTNCPITHDHPAHLVDEDGNWILTGKINGWCRGRGELGHE